MINYQKGNLLDVTAGVIVHGCNTKGVMGAGVAKAIKEKYPECYEKYKRSIDNNWHELGDVVWWEKDGLYIANALTQNNFGRNAMTRYVDYQAVHRCFYEVCSAFYEETDCIHFPKIGAGLGGGNWEVIEQLILAAYDLSNCQAKLTCWELA